MLISIIIPMYNAEKNIKKCIMSILRSTYKKIEILVVDDGSTDQSVNIVKKIDDDRIRIIEKKNGGPSSARNKGISESKGKYIMFIDSDDYIEDNVIENLYYNVIKSKENELISIKRNDVYGNRSIYIECNNEYKTESFIKNILNDKLLGVIWGFIFEKNKIDGISFDTKTFFMEDTAFLFEYIIKNNINTIRYLKKENGLYCYVQNLNSITNSKKNPLKKIENISYSLKKIENILKQDFKEEINERKIDLYERELRDIKTFNEINMFYKIVGNEKLTCQKKKNKFFCLLINKRKKFLLLFYYRVRYILKRIMIFRKNGKYNVRRKK